jgi:hypothetical protein
MGTSCIWMAGLRHRVQCMNVRRVNHVAAASSLPCDADVACNIMCNGRLHYRLPFSKRPPACRPGVPGQAAYVSFSFQLLSVASYCFLRFLQFDCDGDRRAFAHNQVSSTVRPWSWSSSRVDSAFDSTAAKAAAHQALQCWFEVTVGFHQSAAQG